MKSNSYIGPFPKATYQKRRNELLQRLRRLEKDFTCLFWSGTEAVRNEDSTYPFRAESSFLYLTGFSEPDSLLVYHCVGGKTRTAIGLRPRDLSNSRGSELWDGERLGLKRAPLVLGVDESFDVQQGEAFLKDRMKTTPCLFWGFGLASRWDEKVIRLYSQVNNGRGGPFVHTIRDPRPILNLMRKIKTAEEVSIMRQSAQIGARGHIRAIESVRPGQYEYQVAAEVEREFLKAGAQAPAYTTIAASGNNACILHYVKKRDRIKDGELMLLDAGAELHGYASDITRCFPSNGRFTKEQNEIYSWVLKAQEAAIRSVRPGALMSKPHETAVKVLIKGLRTMKILKGSESSIYKKNEWKKYMPHGTSHWIGMDVHDVGRYMEEQAPNKWVKLVSGNVITVEPGLYFRNNDSSVPKKYRGIGVRIEDDVLVTRKSCEVLTSSCPKTIKDIEALRTPKL